MAKTLNCFDLRLMSRSSLVKRIENLFNKSTTCRGHFAMYRLTSFRLHEPEYVAPMGTHARAEYREMGYFFTGLIKCYLILFVIVSPHENQLRPARLRDHLW